MSNQTDILGKCISRTVTMHNDQKGMDHLLLPRVYSKSVQLDRLIALNRVPSQCLGCVALILDSRLDSKSSQKCVRVGCFRYFLTLSPKILFFCRLGPTNKSAP